MRKLLPERRLEVVVVIRIGDRRQIPDLGGQQAGVVEGHGQLLRCQGAIDNIGGGIAAGARIGSSLRESRQSTEGEQGGAAGNQASLAQEGASSGRILL